MLKTVTGDILHTKCQAIAHGVAPNDDFSHGLALSLRKNWPAMYKDIRHFTQTTNPKPGTLWIWGGTSGTRIINLFTQEGSEGHQTSHGSKATLTNVNHCLKALRKEIDDCSIKSLALPRIATGVGGLDWKDIKPLIEEHLNSLSIPVIIYETYTADLEAEEGI